MTQNFVKKTFMGKKLVVWCHEQDLKIMFFYFQTAESNYIEIFLPRGVIGCNVTTILALFSLTIVAVIIFSIRKLKVNKKIDNWRKLDENEGTKKCFESQIIWTKDGLLPMVVTSSKMFVRTHFIHLSYKSLLTYAHVRPHIACVRTHLRNPTHCIWIIINIIRK